jgi:hypothetical protein
MTPSLPNVALQMRRADLTVNLFQRVLTRNRFCLLLMTDSTELRREIKAWEKSFKSENDRDPSVQDIKANPEVGMWTPDCHRVGNSSLRPS